MYIEDLKDEAEEKVSIGCDEKLGFLDAKRVAVGVGARVLFYPTLLYNVIRNKMQAEFRWWDEVDEFLLLGAVPFPSDVPCLKQLGVCGVITLNEPYETLVPTSLYLAYGIEHLVTPTRDYCFAPSLGDICRAVDFIHNNASSGKTTYVHCKAGRGRSTTIVLCYLVRYKHMTPAAAYEHVRLSRPRVLLASPQWQAVQEYYHLQMSKTRIPGYLNYPHPTMMKFEGRKLVKLEESSFIVISKSDLDGYDPNDCSGSGSVWELSLVCRVQFAGQAALASLSCFWLRCAADNKLGTGHPCLVSGVVVKVLPGV